MHITGIIAEYNPFHNGHKYHLEETRRITGADFCIAIISGDFVQRGTPAIIDKYVRTEMALRNGVDLVLELPLCYACGSAEFFADGAVALLDRLGAVDSLCFGSECGDIHILTEIASLLMNEPEAYQLALQKALREGHSLPKARSMALSSCLPFSSSYQEALSSPNNILGIEYVKALLKRNSRITPYTITRQGSGYHDTSLTSAVSLPGGCTNNHPPLSSASAIRSCLEHDIFSEYDNTLKHPADSTVLTELQTHVPESVYALLKKNYHRCFPIFSNDFSSLLHYRLLLQASNGFTDYMDVTADLSDKIIKNLNQFEGYEPFCGQLKSKDMTYSRISRSLLHILLDLTDRQMREWQTNQIYYARILGFRRSSIPLLGILKNSTSVPLISKLADASGYLTPTGLSMLEKDIQAAHIYDSVISSKFHTPFVNEYSKQLVILD